MSSRRRRENTSLSLKLLLEWVSKLDVGLNIAGNAAVCGVLQRDHIAGGQCRITRMKRSNHNTNEVQANIANNC
jgi:hypothetical protein